MAGAEESTASWKEWRDWDPPGSCSRNYYPGPYVYPHERFASTLARLTVIMAYSFQMRGLSQCSRSVYMPGRMNTKTYSLRFSQCQDTTGTTCRQWMSFSQCRCRSVSFAGGSNVPVARRSAVSAPGRQIHDAGYPVADVVKAASSSRSNTSASHVNIVPFGRARLSTWQCASPPSSSVKMTSLLSGFGSCSYVVRAS